MEIEQLVESLKTTLADPQPLSASGWGTNRGQKLEPGAHGVSCVSLNPLFKRMDQWEQGMLSESNYAEPNEPGATDSISEVDIDIKNASAAILRPLTCPADVASNPHVRRIFESSVPAKLSSDLLDRLVEEKAHLSSAKKLLDALLGDDDELLAKLIMSSDPGDIRFTQPKHAENEMEVDAEAAVNSAIPEAATPVVPQIPPVPSLDGSRDKIPEWVFAIPRVKTDENLGLEAEKAAKLREKLQIVVQYYEEYTSRLTEIRMGLTRTQRLRRRVLNWCRELNGEDYVKEDLDHQNGNDNAGLGEMMPKDKPPSPENEISNPGV